MARIITLDFDENPIHEITGNIVSGNINLDGSSACRRTCNLSLITMDKNVNELDWQLKTKYQLSIALHNFVNDKYPEWIWFPMGIFILTDLSIQNNLQGFTVSIQGRDKMCLLDGSVGGALFAEHNFGVLDVRDEDGNISYEEILIPTIIKEAIHVYAKEAYENIIINDLEDVSVELLDYKMSNLICYIYETDRYIHSEDEPFTNYVSQMTFDRPGDLGEKFTKEINNNPNLQPVCEGKIFQIRKEEGEEGENNWDSRRRYRIVKRLEYGDTAGYRRTDLTYPGDLIINAGGTIVDLLKKITDLLGEFEYFYDVYGRFIFQRKRIYHNVVWNGSVPTEEVQGYFTSSEASQTVYDFAGSQLVESYSNKPKIQNVRNDWAVWGQLNSSSGNDKTKFACHLRYAIDDKPQIYHCLTDGYWYYTKEYDFMNRIHEDEEFCELVEECLDVYRSIQAINSTEPEFEDTAISTLRAIINLDMRAQCKKVDYRELIYRMAIDQSQAESRLKELYAIDKSPGILTVLNPNIYQTINAGNLYESVIANPNVEIKDEQGNLIDKYDHGYELLHYYDNQAIKFKSYSNDDLIEFNKKRLEKNQAAYDFEKYVQTRNHNVIFGALNWSTSSYTDYIKPQKIVYNDILGSNSGNDVKKLYNFIGYKHAGWKTVASNNYPIFELTKEDAHKIIYNEIVKWEKRLNSPYAIYFADMLGFWNLYYKTENNLANTDVPEDLKAGLSSESGILASLNSLNFSRAQTVFSNSVASLKRRTALSPEDREMYCKMYITTYKNTLRNLNDSVINYQIQLEKAIIKYSDQEGIFDDTENGDTTALRGIADEQLKYITDQHNTNLKIPEGSTAIDSIDDILLATEARYKTFAELMEGTKDKKGLLEKLEGKMATHKTSLVNMTYATWRNNGYWNPDFISYDVVNDEITFINPENLLFWIDFMDTYSELGKFKIGTIGHRAKVVNDDKVKAIFFRETPTVLFLNKDDFLPAEQNLSYTKLQLAEGKMSDFFQISAQGKSAKDVLDTLLYETTYFEDTITVNCIPIYYFEPNQRIRVVDNDSGIRGDYIIKNYSISLDYSGMMSITAYKATDRII